MNPVLFEDPRAKAENARAHIALAESRFEAFAQSGPTIREDADQVNFGPAGELPRSIPLAVGDAIHNLRSALDIMAGDVVQASGKSRKDVSFPFAGSEEGLEKQIVQKKFHRAAPEALDLLRTFKPHKGGNIALRAIHDLDLTDKHQFILPTFKAAHVPLIQIGGIRFTNSTFGGNGVDIAFRGDGPRPSVHISGGVKLSLRFAPNRPLAEEEVIPTLRRLAELTDTVIEAFAALFGAGRFPA